MSEEKRTTDGEPRAEENAAEPAPEAENTVSVPVEEFEELSRRATERDDFFQRLQRKVAEFENYQKRVKRDRTVWEDAKIRRFLLDFLPVLDDFERVLGALNGELSREDLNEAFRLLNEKIMRTLATWKIEAIPAEGNVFDPNLHEALRHEETDCVAPGEVMQDLRRGYTIKGGVLRAAQVVVAREPQPVTEDDTNEAPAGADDPEEE